MLNVDGNRLSRSSLTLTINAKNGVKVEGFIVVQHQAQKAMAQILLAGEGERSRFSVR